MKLFVISDLHVCALKSIDKFGWDDRRFIIKLSLFKEINKIDKVIFNGDTFDLYFSTLEEIKSVHEELYHFITTTEWIDLLKGNHDKKLLVPDVLVINGVYIEHGNKGDFNENKLFQFIAESFYKLSDFFCKKIPFIGNKYIEIYKTNKANNINSVNKYGKAKLFENNIVIMSHSHNQEITAFSSLGVKKVYANSGSCSNGRFEGILIDTDTKEVKEIKER